MPERDTPRSSVRPVYRPPEEWGGREAGTFILRDGSRLGLQRALPEDASRIRDFLGRLPREELHEVTESLRLEVDEVDGFLERLSGGVGEAFFAEGPPPEDRVVAFGGYRQSDLDEGAAGDAGMAALAVAVDPDFRQMGIASLLLERVSVLAAQKGLDRLVGVANAENRPLTELFRRSGFEPEEHREGDAVTFVLDTRRAERAKALEEGDRSGGVHRRVFAAASLRPLFHPRAVAVVGASREESAVGRRILDSLLSARFEGPVYPINPKARHVGSVRAYGTVSEVGDERIDLAVVAVPADVVPEVVDDCARAGVRGLVTITAGFAEIGGDGTERQERLLEQVRSAGLRMVGPNCLGLLHTDPGVSLNASFAPRMPPRGSVALCSQSGALGVAIIALARRLGLGLSSFVSVGNKADVSGNDLLEYWEEDASTRVVLFYLESFGNPRRFARIARRVGRTKPIVVVKAGRTEAGGRAASSHTAALTAPETAVHALFEQTGIIRADTLEEMFGVARVLSDQPLPRGRRVAVVTNAGGPSILCTDALEAAGMEVEELSDATKEALRGILPDAASVTNPVDMIASAGPQTYRRATEIVLAAEEVDAMVVIYTPVGMFDLGAVRRAVRDGVEAARGRSDAASRKPVLASIVGSDEEVHVLGPSRAADEGEGGERIPAYPFPEEMGRVLGKVADYADWRRSDPGLFRDFGDQKLDEARELCRSALEERGEGWLSVEEARRVLALANLTVADGGVAASADEAAEIAGRVGYPVAVKLASTEIVHKTEVGGIELDLADADAVRAAWESIRGRLAGEGREDAMEGVLVQPMLSGTAEVMIGVQQDPVFGPLVAFGLGGIHVEVLEDVAFRVSPLTDEDAAEMVREIRGYRLLQGYRGYPAADVEALEEALLRISRLVEAVPEIGELDLNPIFALEPGEGYRVVDARIGVTGG